MKARFQAVCLNAENKAFFLFPAHERKTEGLSVDRSYSFERKNNRPLVELRTE